MNIPEEDFICLQNIKPIFKGVTVQKRKKAKGQLLIINQPYPKIIILNDIFYFKIKNLINCIFRSCQPPTDQLEFLLLPY